MLRKHMAHDEPEDHPFFFHARLEAKTIFQKLDYRFNPSLHLVGFPLEKGKCIVVGPQGTPFRPDDFRRVEARVAELVPLNPESQVTRMPDPVHGWTDAHEKREQAIMRRIRWTALTKATTEAASVASGNAEFNAYCSWPVVYQEMEVILILQLQKEIHNSHFHMTKTTYVKNWQTEEYRVDRSLIDAVAYRFLNASGEVLTRENPGWGFYNVKDLDQVLLTAAKALMYTPALVGGGREIHGLFEVFVNLSTLKYEGKEGVGRIVIARPKHPQIDVDFALSTPVPLRSSGAVRKLLQMASGHLCLLCDSGQIYALGRISPSYEMAREDIFDCSLHQAVRLGSVAWRPLSDAGQIWPAGYACLWLP